MPHVPSERFAIEPPRQHAPVMTAARSPPSFSPSLSSCLGCGLLGPRSDAASGPPSQSASQSHDPAARVNGPRQPTTSPPPPMLYGRRSPNAVAPRHVLGVASPPSFAPAPRISPPAFGGGTASASSSGFACSSSSAGEAPHVSSVPRGPRPSPSARPALALHADECPPYPCTPPTPLSRSSPRMTPSGVMRPSLPMTPGVPLEPAFSPPQPSPQPSAHPRSSARALSRQLPQVRPPAQPLPPDEDNYVDMVLPCGLYQDQVIDAMYRDLGPEDFEMLCKLDENVPRRNTARRDSVDQLPRVAAQELEAGATCGVCLSEFESSERVVRLPCRHTFHAKCISKWLTQYKDTCPLCSAPISCEDDSSTAI